MSALVAGLVDAGAMTPLSDVLMELERILQQFPALEAVLVSLQAEVGATNINWAVVVSVVKTVVVNGGGFVAVVLALLANLNTILVTSTATATTTANAAAAVVSHLT